MWLTVCTAVVGYVPEGNFKRWLNYKVSIVCFTFLSSALSSVITYHNPENRPVGGICVANHTSPIDVLVLMCDNCYSLVRLWYAIRYWICSFFFFFFFQDVSVSEFWYYDFSEKLCLNFNFWNSPSFRLFIALISVVLPFFYIPFYFYNQIFLLCYILKNIFRTMLFYNYENMLLTRYFVLLLLLLLSYIRHSI